MKQFLYQILIIALLPLLGLYSCSSDNADESSSSIGDEHEMYTESSKDVINPGIAAQQFCDCSILENEDKIVCYNNWIDVYRNDNTAIAQAKQMTLEMAKCNPKEALEVVEKMMSGGYYEGEIDSVLNNENTLSLINAFAEFCDCIEFSIVEKEACLNNWVAKYKKASGSKSDGLKLQKQMQECSEEDAITTWKKLLKK